MKQRLTAKEEEVMNIIWAKGEVFSRSETELQHCGDTGEIP